MSKLALKDLDLAALEKQVVAWGQPRYRGRQLAEWIFKKGVTDFDDMTNLPADFRSQLQHEAEITRLVVLKKLVSDSGDTVKYLFGLADGGAVEGVLMKHNYGRTACVSTQVGCRMGCLFCASALGGWERNLTAGEIYDQVLTIQKDEGCRISHIVVMGTGEPLDNYEHTMRFIDNISAPYGLLISPRRITLSTCGLVPAIRRLAGERRGLTLAVSLHAPNDELRNRLVPVNRRYPLGELIPACRDYAAATGRRVSLEYALLRGYNDRPELAHQLAELSSGWLCHVNLIPVNVVPERGFYPPSRKRIQYFKNILMQHGIPVTIRKEMGADINAACGQLRWKNRKGDKE
ncbi:MAG: 23S rRNA (adenine(2503)-C(2))-methyltransferase RlmN [Peptococcaceae bacterium]|nr:23S rRNA (adenine(2503)-C(2))-methyltransferase RlmN [Peptococcaceae bacterium]